MRILFMLICLLCAVAALAQDCTLGNPQGVVSYEAGWIVDGTVYAQFTDPMIGSCDCDPGFIVDVIHCELVLDETSSFTAQAFLMDAVYTEGCPAPGEILAVSELFLVEGLDEFGLHCIDIPCDFQCAVMDEQYFLAVQLSGISGPMEMPFTGSDTGVPGKQAPGDPCSAYMFGVAGWEDMVLDGFWGGLPITASVTCCGDPIADGFDTWGNVKMSYK